MKAWRRTSSGRSTAAAVAAPLVTSVIDSGFNTATVTFNTNVTWNMSGAGNFEINGSAGSWTNQLAPAVLEWSPSTSFASGDPWDWTAADPELTPSPNPAQTGTVS